MTSQAVLPNNTVIGYTYNANNRRIAKKVNGVITERFLYKDQLEPVAKIDGNGDILELYIYGEKGHVPGYIVKGGQTYRVISDHLGSVRMIVNANTSLRIATAWQAGDIAQEITYNEFGIVLTDSNPGFQPFYYAGGVYDLDTNLVKLGARDYDPSTGRWLQKEPLGFEGSMNFYIYAKNDPINHLDIDGKEAITTAIAIVAIGGGAAFLYEYWDWIKESLDWKDKTDQIKSEEDLSWEEMLEEIEKNEDLQREAINETADCAKAGSNIAEPGSSLPTSKWDLFSKAITKLLSF